MEKLTTLQCNWFTFLIEYEKYTEKFKSVELNFTVRRLLEKHVDKLINGRNNIRIFFPFCGKALDMKW